MATATTEAPQATMTAELWFDGGGQLEELQRISSIKDTAKKQAALQQFNTSNEQFLKLRSAEGPDEKAKTHPAIEDAINKTIQRETDWMQDIRRKSDEDLRFRYLERQLSKAVRQGRVPEWTPVSEFLESKPDLVDVANKYNRTELERKEVLARMIERQGFSVAKAKIEYETRLNPTLVATAKLNIASRKIGAGKYNDVLFAEVSKVKKILTNAQTAGFKP
jgi:hypothetical protein